MQRASINFDITNILASEAESVFFTASDGKIIRCSVSMVDLYECKDSGPPLTDITPDLIISWCYDYIPEIIADSPPPPGPVIDQEDSAVCGDDGMMVFRVVLLQDKRIWLLALAR